MPLHAEKNNLQNCYLGDFGILKFWKVGDFFNIFFVQQIPPNFKIFKKQEYIY